MSDTKKMYIVMGHNNGGSASLTYPEDFETVGVFLTKEGAQAKVDELNEETLEGHEDDDGNPIEDIDDLESGDGTVMIYDFSEVDVLG